jgi:hypothetical protein
MGPFVASLFDRTRKVRAHISEAMSNALRQKIDDPDFIRELQHSLLEYGELHFADDLRRRFTERREAMDASPSFYHVSGLPNRLQVLVPSLRTRDWHTLEAPAGSYFLISDCPVLTLGARGPGAGFGNEDIPWLCCHSAQSMSFTHHRNTWGGSKSSTRLKHKTLTA